MSPNKEVCVLEISVQLRQLHPLETTAPHGTTALPGIPCAPLDFPSLLK